MKLKTFTLTELLITLTVIGVVASMTIPTLADRIKSLVKNTAVSVISKRFENGITLTNLSEGAFNGRVYNDSYDFIRLLSKYFKIVSACNSENLDECFPYKEINYEKPDGSINKLSINSIDLQQLNLSNDTHSYPASFITGSGISYIIAVKKDCMADPDSFDKIKENPMKCIDGLYDYNGAQGPNKFGLDIITIGEAGLYEAACLHRFGDICVATGVIEPNYNEATAVGSACNSIKTSGEFTDTNGLFGEKGEKIKVKINSANTFCSRSTDYWLGAKVKCESKGLRLPNNDELAAMAKEIHQIQVDMYPLANNKTYSGAKWADMTEFGFPAKYNSTQYTLNLISENKADLWMYYLWQYNWMNDSYRATRLSIEQTNQASTFVCIK